MRVVWLGCVVGTLWGGWAVAAPSYLYTLAEAGALGTNVESFYLSKLNATNGKGDAVGFSHAVDASQHDIADHAAAYINGQWIDVVAGTSYGTNSTAGTYTSTLSSINAGGVAVGTITWKPVSGKATSLTGFVWDRTALNPIQTVPVQSVNPSGDGSSYSSLNQISNSGIAIGLAYMYYGTSGSHSSVGIVRDTAGNVTQISLGNSSSGVPASSLVGINAAGVAIGYATKYDAKGANKGSRGVVWRGGELIEVPALSQDTTSGIAYSPLAAINNNGIAVGTSRVYSGSSYTTHGIVWDTRNDSTATPVEVQPLTPNAGNITLAAINGDGIATGKSDYYVSGVKRGTHAIIYNCNSDYDAVNNHPIDVDNGGGGTDRNGASTSELTTINAHGTAVGDYTLYDADHNAKGTGMFVYYGNTPYYIDINPATDMAFATNSMATFLSDHDDVFGAYASVASGPCDTAFVWLHDTKAAVDLASLISPEQMAGWNRLDRIVGEIADGVYVGYGERTTSIGGSTTEAFVLALNVPEPTCALWLAGLAGLVLRRSRRDEV